MTQPEHTEQLAAINGSILAPGETLPVVELRDGKKVQTGTVATMLNNVERYNAGERGAIPEALQLAVPTLFAVGLFDLFAPEEWIAGNNAGRRLVGELALAYRASTKPA